MTSSLTLSIASDNLDLLSLFESSLGNKIASLEADQETISSASNQQLMSFFNYNSASFMNNHGKKNSNNNHEDYDIRLQMIFLCEETQIKFRKLRVSASRKKFQGVTWSLVMKDDPDNGTTVMIDRAFLYSFANKGKYCFRFSIKASKLTEMLSKNKEELDKTNRFQHLDFEFNFPSHIKIPVDFTVSSYLKTITLFQNGKRKNSFAYEIPSSISIEDEDYVPKRSCLMSFYHPDLLLEKTMPGNFSVDTDMKTQVQVRLDGNICGLYQAQTPEDIIAKFKNPFDELKPFFAENINSTVKQYYGVICKRMADRAHEELDKRVNIKNTISNEITDTEKDIDIYILDYFFISSVQSQYNSPVSAFLSFSCSQDPSKISGESKTYLHRLESYSINWKSLANEMFDSNLGHQLILNCIKAFSEASRIKNMVGLRKESVCEWIDNTYRSELSSLKIIDINLPPVQYFQFIFSKVNKLLSKLGGKMVYKLRYLPFARIIRGDKDSYEIAVYLIPPEQIEKFNEESKIEQEPLKMEEDVKSTRGRQSKTTKDRSRSSSKKKQSVKSPEKKVSKSKPRSKRMTQAEMVNIQARSRDSYVKCLCSRQTRQNDYPSTIYKPLTKIVIRYHE